MTNYIPNKYITIDDKNPVWMNDTLKARIKTKNILFKQFMRLENEKFESDFGFLAALIAGLNKLISSTKTMSYENLVKKFNNCLIQAKTLLNS